MARLCYTTAGQREYFSFIELNSKPESFIGGHRHHISPKFLWKISKGVYAEGVDSPDNLCYLTPGTAPQGWVLGSLWKGRKSNG